MIYQRKTLAADAVFEGLGVHSGVPVRIVVRPSESGIAFRHGSTVWEARPENVTDTTRCTKLGEIATVEHLMSAFAGLEITDADVEVSQPELPALDGASSAYCEGLFGAGLQDLGEASIEGPFARVYEKGEGHEVAISHGHGWWRYLFDTGERWPGRQDFEIRLDPETYRAQIAHARTFGFEEELPRLRAAGLAQGLDERSAFVLGHGGYLNPTLYPDEPVRHKLLDLIGDLYLAGVPIRLLNVVAERSGHSANVRAAMKLAQAVRASGA